jgi:hypothetical protein
MGKGGQGLEGRIGKVSNRFAWGEHKQMVRSLVVRLISINQINATHIAIYGSVLKLASFLPLSQHFRLHISLPCTGAKEMYVPCLFQWLSVAVVGSRQDRQMNKGSWTCRTWHYNQHRLHWNLLFHQRVGRALTCRITWTRANLTYRIVSKRFSGSADA